MSVRHHNIFCYGSNLYSRRLRERVADARFVAKGFVRERRLEFHKQSVDGSAKADAYVSGASNDCVWGAVYAIPDDQKPTLDACEYLGQGYDEVSVTVETADAAILKGRLYQARPQAIALALRPYDWYLALIVAGAREHALPEKYVQWLTRVDCIADDDGERRDRHRRLLSEP